MPTPARPQIMRELVFFATKSTIRADIKGKASGQKPVLNIPGVNRSLATSAAKAAGAIKFNPSVALGDKALPFNKKAGATRQINIQTVITAKIIQYSVQLINFTTQIIANAFAGFVVALFLESRTIYKSNDDAKNCSDYDRKAS